MEEDLCWRTTIKGRQPLVEDNLQWRTIFEGRQSLMQGNLWRQKTDLLSWRLFKQSYDTKDQVLSVSGIDGTLYAPIKI